MVEPDSPDGAMEYFAEAAREDDKVVAIEALQCRHRPSRVAILTVVVVFEDECAGFLCPVEQLQASWQAHCRAQGELMARRGVKEPG